MNNFIKYIFMIIISINIYANTNNQMDDFFSLQKEPSSLKRDIKIINLIYYLGYPEKSKQKLYIILDNFSKKEFDKNIKEIFELLNKNHYDKKILNSISYIINNKKTKPLDKEIIDIYRDKDKKIKVLSHILSNTIKESNKHNKAKDNNQNIVKQHHSDENNNIKKNPNNKLEKRIELAIVLSEWLDDLNIENSIKYSQEMSNDKYYSIIYSYLNYLKDKQVEKIEKINKNSPTYYHFLISIYKKNNNIKKASIYLNKLKKEYPNYLKYNRIDL